MTFAHQLEQKGLQKGLQQGERRKALLIARKLLKKNVSLDIIKSATVSQWSLNSPQALLINNCSNS